MSGVFVDTGFQASASEQARYEEGHSTLEPWAFNANSKKPFAHATKVTKDGGPPTKKMALQQSAGTTAADTTQERQIEDVKVPPSMSLRYDEDFVFSFGGTTWLDNLKYTGVNGTGQVDANQWSSFPWEFPLLWCQQSDLQMMYSKYQYYKPESVTLEFMNPLCFCQIDTGATPFMMPNGNGRITMLVDTDYNLALDSCPYGLGGIDHINTSVTQAQVLTYIQNLHASYVQDGFTNGAGTTPDAQQFQPNGVLPGNVTYIGHPASKSMRAGSGNSMKEHWEFGNKWWRSTTDLVSRPVGQEANFACCLSMRGDEYLGVVQNTSTGSNNDVGVYTYPTNVASTTTNVGQYSATFANLGEVGTMYIGGTSTPIPKLCLHLAADVGVLGTTGANQCQLNFKITYKFKCSGRRPPFNNTALTTTSNTILTNPNVIQTTAKPNLWQSIQTQSNLI